MKLQINDIAFSIDHIVDSIPQEALELSLRNTGCPAYFLFKSLNLNFPVFLLSPLNHAMY